MPQSDLQEDRERGRKEDSKEKGTGWLHAAAPCSTACQNVSAGGRRTVGRPRFRFFFVSVCLSVCSPPACPVCCPFCSPGQAAHCAPSPPFRCPSAHSCALLCHSNLPPSPFYSHSFFTNKYLSQTNTSNSSHFTASPVHWLALPSLLLLLFFVQFLGFRLKNSAQHRTNKNTVSAGPQHTLHLPSLFQNRLISLFHLLHLFSLPFSPLTPPPLILVGFSSETSS